MTINKKRILLVDDNAAIHEDFKHILMAGRSSPDDEKAILEHELFSDSETLSMKNLPLYQIDDSFQGEEAIAMVDAADREGVPYAVIFMDVRMPPGMDGIQATSEIWKRHPNVEVVICTAHSDYSWNDIQRTFGNTDHLLFIHKPFDSVTIKQTALTLCTKWELDRQNREYINTLEARIAERTKDLQLLIKEKEIFIDHVREEMALAEIVQHHLLPTDLPSMHDIKIAAHFIPTEEIGGDLYDIVPLDEGRTAFLIFDVSGHGIAAALVATVAKFSFRRHLQGAESPAEVMALVNKDIFSTTPPDMFISAFLLIYDPRTRDATFTGAGHPAPLIVRSGEGVIDKLIIPGLFLGVNDNTRYAIRNIRLNAKDKILFYTDGLIETSNAEEVLYSRERLIKIIAEKKEESCEELLQRILLDNERFRSNQRRTDDLCILGVEIG
jgi:serine phosphatase RsbU (regulator of sigma subunit)